MQTACWIERFETKVTDVFECCLDRYDTYKHNVCTGCLIAINACDLRECIAVLGCAKGGRVARMEFVNFAKHVSLHG